MILNLMLSIYYVYYLREKSECPDFDYSFQSYLKNYVAKNKHQVLGIPLNKEVCHENLALIHHIFQKHNIVFWLSEGTALGFLRDRDFISFDDDVDIGIWYQDYSKFLRAFPDLRSAGFDLCEVRQTNSFFVFVRRGEKVDIDITGDQLKCVSNWGKSCAPVISFLQEFFPITIKGLVYNLPKEGYVEFLYGKDWRIPQRKKK